MCSIGTGFWQVSLASLRQTGWDGGSEQAAHLAELRAAAGALLTVQAGRRAVDGQPAARAVEVRHGPWRVSPDDGLVNRWVKWTKSHKRPASGSASRS